MSNNKLYTEQQIFKYLLEHGTIDLDSFMLHITPIELPSDKEIKDASIKYYVNKSACFYFEIGAKYLRDKIQGGNND